MDMKPIDIPVWLLVWLITGALLGIVVMLVVVGWIRDRFGKCSGDHIASAKKGGTQKGP